MAVTANHLETAGEALNQDSYDTGSISPTANQLILLFVVSHVGGGTPGVPVVTGCNLTWVQAATITFDPIASPEKRMTLFRAMGGSPTTGALTIDFSSETQGRCIWSVSEFDGVDTGGTNGSAAVLQPDSDRADLVTTLTVTLGAFGDAGNATVGAFAIGNNETITEGSGFAILGQAAADSENMQLASEWRNDNDTSVDASWSGTRDAGGLAAEIKAAAAAGGDPFVTVEIRAAP
jgi:hypothetical protein